MPALHQVYWNKTRRKMWMMLQAIHPYSHKLIRAKESMFFCFSVIFFACNYLLSLSFVIALSCFEWNSVLQWTFVLIHIWSIVTIYLFHDNSFNFSITVNICVYSKFCLFSCIFSCILVSFWLCRSRFTNTKNHTLTVTVNSWSILLKLLLHQASTNIMLSRRRWTSSWVAWRLRSES